MHVRYRLWQFWQELRAGPLPCVAQKEVATILAAEEQRLYHCYSQSDQWHTYRVLHTLTAAGHTHPALLKAALLHDIGKTRFDLELWERVVAVLGLKLFPNDAARWGEGVPRGWRRPFAVKVQHPVWGAEMAEAAGSPPLAVALIRRHQEDMSGHATDLEGKLLRQLQWADNQN